MLPMHGSSPAGAAGSELSRLLALMSDAPPSGPRPEVAERLGHWLGWTGAIALSAALNARADATPPAGARAAAGREEADFHRVRANLEAAIAAGPRDADPSPTDFAPLRRHGLALEQAMHDAIAALRARLRHALAQRSAEGARLAALDAAMATPLDALEHSLLGLVMLRLQAHFERLRRTAGDDPGWLEAFRDDMNQVLRAELAHRLLPAQGLLDALRQD